MDTSQLERAARPDDILADNVNTTEINGLTIRKGTVAAFLSNALLITQQDVPTETYEEALSLIKEYLPSLKALRLFDVFTIKSDKLKSLLLEMDPDLQL